MESYLAESRALQKGLRTVEGMGSVVEAAD